ncbi:MAG: alpha/beta fold hydrolase [Candidatus Nanopelagicales bacterium]
MVDSLNIGKVARSIGAAAGLLAVGAAAGVVAEKTVVAGSGRADSESDEPFGRLRGKPVTVTTPDGGVIYAEIEEPTRPNPENLTLVFCHGYALSQDCFHYQRRDLRPLGRLVFYDQRSHGRSARGESRTSTLDQLGTDLHHVLNQVVPDGPVILVGHSMGGMTLMACALEHPELFGTRVRGVALLATSPGGLSDISLGLPKMASKPLQRLLPITTSALVRNMDFVEAGRSRVNDLALWFTKYYSFGSTASPAMAEFCHRIINATKIDVISEFLATLRKHERATALATLADLPSIIMVGETDRMTPAEHSKAMARDLPRAELTLIPDTGHMLILERYPIVNDGLRKLVARVRAELGERPYDNPAGYGVSDAGAAGAGRISPEPADQATADLARAAADVAVAAGIAPREHAGE